MLPQDELPKIAKMYGLSLAHVRAIFKRMVAESAGYDTITELGEAYLDEQRGDDEEYIFDLAAVAKSLDAR